MFKETLQNLLENIFDKKSFKVGFLGETIEIFLAENFETNQ